VLQNFYRIGPEIELREKRIDPFDTISDMKFDLRSLLEGIASYVLAMFEHADTSKLLYHNYEHTVGVVQHVKEMTSFYGLDEEQEFVVLAAAWFHDTGHLYGEWEKHEERSVSIAEFFLFDKELPQLLLDSIAGCIMATKMTVSPISLVEQIICDADTYHLGTMEFFERNELVWGEMEIRLGKKISNRVIKSIGFLELHQFYTTYCRQLLQQGKEQNIQRLKAVL
jgi:predicted metal-dependent HD superfamily phosphohydrolase